MPADPLYDLDFYAWTQHQAALLRKGHIVELDLENVAEEVDSLGRRDKREVSSRLEILVMHLLKWRYQPEARAQSHSWYDTIVEQRRELELVLDDSPSLRRQVPELLAQRYSHAHRRALHETRFAEHALPIECPWNVTQVLDDTFWPEE